MRVNESALSKVKTWLAGMETKKHKWAARYTWATLTMGCDATQRAESVHAAIAPYVGYILLAELLKGLDAYVKHVDLAAETKNIRALRINATCAEPFARTRPPGCRLTWRQCHRWLAHPALRPPTPLCGRRQLQSPQLDAAAKVVAPFPVNLLRAQVAQASYYGVAPLLQENRWVVTRHQEQDAAVVEGDSAATGGGSVAAVAGVGIAAAGGDADEPHAAANSGARATEAGSSASAAGIDGAAAGAEGETSAGGAAGAAVVAGAGSAEAGRGARVDKDGRWAAAEDADYGLRVPAWSRARAVSKREDGVFHCSCQFHSHMGLPCRHIVAVAQSVGVIAFSKEQFSPQWCTHNSTARDSLLKALLATRPRSVANASGGTGLTPSDRYALIMSTARSLAEFGSTTDSACNSVRSGMQELMTKLRRPLAASPPRQSPSPSRTEAGIRLHQLRGQHPACR